MADDLFSVADQVVVVSGGSRGIGKALAAGFAARGAKVVITGREADTLDQTAKEISTGTHPVRTVVCDVSDVLALESQALESAHEVWVIGWSVPQTDGDQRDLIRAAVARRPRPIERLRVVRASQLRYAVVALFQTIDLGA